MQVVCKSDRVGEFRPLTIALTMENANEAHAVYELLRSIRVNDYLDVAEIDTYELRKGMREAWYGDDMVYPWSYPTGAKYDALVNQMIDEA